MIIKIRITANFINHLLCVVQFCKHFYIILKILNANIIPI